MLKKQNPAAGLTAGHYQKELISSAALLFLYIIGLMGSLYIECQFGML